MIEELEEVQREIDDKWKEIFAKKITESKGEKIKHDKLDEIVKENQSRIDPISLTLENDEIIQTLRKVCLKFLWIQRRTPNNKRR